MFRESSAAEGRPAQDVTMTTNKMSVVRKPSVYMQLHFDDGSLSAFECSVERFQDWRYNVARMLKVRCVWTYRDHF